MLENILSVLSLIVSCLAYREGDKAHRALVQDRTRQFKGTALTFLIQAKAISGKEESFLLNYKKELFNEKPYLEKRSFKKFEKYFFYAEKMMKLRSLNSNESVDKILNLQETIEKEIKNLEKDCINIRNEQLKFIRSLNKN